MVLFGLKIFTKHGLLLALLRSNTDCNLNMLCLVGFVCEVLGCFWSEHWEKWPFKHLNESVMWDFLGISFNFFYHFYREWNHLHLYLHAWAKWIKLCGLSYKLPVPIILSKLIYLHFSVTSIISASVFFYINGLRFQGLLLLQGFS